MLGHRYISIHIHNVLPSNNRQLNQKKALIWQHGKRIRRKIGSSASRPPRFTHRPFSTKNVSEFFLPFAFFCPFRLPPKHFGPFVPRCDLNREKKKKKIV